MSLYSIERLINETRKLAAEFKRTTGTMLPVSGEIARYDVARQLNLTLNDHPNEGYDALTNELDQNLRVIIKSRVIGDRVKPGHRIGQINPNGKWDILILSLMNNEFEPVEMYQLAHDDVADALNGASEKRGKRGAISVAKFKIISDLIWTRENGTEHTQCIDHACNAHQGI